MGYEDDELKPYVEPPKDMRDEKRVLKLQNIGYTLQQITEALNRERFEEIHATYLLLKEKKLTEADINGILAGNTGGEANKSGAQASGVDNSSQYPRSLSAQVTTSKTNRRSSHDQQQSGGQQTQPQSQNVAQSTIPEGTKSNTMFYVPNMTNNSSKTNGSRNTTTPTGTTGIAPNSPASVAFRQAPFNNRQPALSVQPATGGTFSKVKNFFNCFVQKHNLKKN